MKLLTVVGARPQFVKAGPVSRELATAGITEVLVHTGQHYDANMSEQFFEELKLPEPNYHLGIGSGSHGSQTGKMLELLETVMQKECPDAVMVYGDTNSTLAGAISAAKLNIGLIHVEAGLRSFNRAMPEEINRVVADHLSALLMAPTPTACGNLCQEGFAEFGGVGDGGEPARGRYLLVGDVMKDALLAAKAMPQVGGCLAELEPKNYYLASLHRPTNVDDPKRLCFWLQALMQSDLPVLLPLHPRTRRVAEQARLLQRIREPLRIMDPLGYVAMIHAVAGARAVLTDSGGLQKEAFMLGTPCITLRGETEWLETLEGGWNQLCPEPQNLWKHVQYLPEAHDNTSTVYGDGHAARKIVECLTQWL